MYSFYLLQHGFLFFHIRVMYIFRKNIYTYKIRQSHVHILPVLFRTRDIFFHCLSVSLKIALGRFNVTVNLWDLFVCICKRYIEVDTNQPVDDDIKQHNLPKKKGS